MEQKQTPALQVLKTSNLLGKEFAIYGTVENPLFLAKDVAEMIEHSNVSKMLASIDEDEKETNIVCVQSDLTNSYVTSRARNTQEMWLITEDGLYEILMQSRKPIARCFKRGIKNILKEIRLKGGYIATAPEETPEQIMAKALKIANETIERNTIALKKEQERVYDLMLQNVELQEQNDALQEDADYTHEVLLSNSVYTFTQIAKDLGFKSVYHFQDFIKKNKIMYFQSGQWLPTSSYSGLGYFGTRTAKYTNARNEIITTMYTVITEKGRCMLHNKINKKLK